MPDDVALHLRGTGFDRVAARPEVAVGPRTVIDSVRIIAEKLAVRAQDFLGDLLQPLVQFTPKKFLDRAFGAGDAGSRHAAERAHLVEAHDFDFGIRLGQFLTDDGIFRGGFAVALKLLRKFDQPADTALKDQVEPRAIGAAFIHEGADGDVPAVVHFAEYVFFRDADVAEEDLVEFAFAGHLLQRTDLHSGCFHVDEQDGETFVLGRRGVGTGNDFAPIADPPVAGPDFLPVDDVMVAIKNRGSLQIGEVRAGVWFRKSLAPDFFGAQNFRYEPFLLGLGAVGDNRRTNQAQTQRVRHRRGFGTRHFFPEDGLLHQRGAAAAKFFWPGNGRPAAFVQLSLPGAKVGIRFFERFVLPLGPVFRDVRREPGPQLVTKLFFFCGEVQIHLKTPS